ncbi:hypothetical protein M0802_011823 [Mischocyttarus mexicanus]|nr:hypothetical protein M0802_011823 [Mischocyttarus mexicanus]
MVGVMLVVVVVNDGGGTGASGGGVGQKPLVEDNVAIKLDWLIYALAVTCLNTSLKQQQRDLNRVLDNVS